METNNRKSEKVNEAHNKAEESNEKDIYNNPETEDSKLKKELETDADGNKSVVDRARDSHEDTDDISSEINHDNPNAKRGVTNDKDAMKTVENKDLNSDITPHRYPNSHPDNHQDRGNMKLDE